MNDNTKSTIQKKIDARLKDLDTAKAQLQLNEWCKGFGMKSWKIDARQANWRELCYRLLGLPPSKTEQNKRGRPAHEHEFEQKVIFALADHTFLAISKEEKLKGTKLYETVANKLGVKSTLKSDHAKGNADKSDYTKPAEIIRGIDQRYDKKQLKKQMETENRKSE